MDRIRDIRSSEKIFYAKIRDIYTTAIDYDPNTEESVLFFKTVQNKMHWAIYGHTASEIIYQRADSDKQNMGLTTWKNAPKGHSDRWTRTKPENPTLSYCQPSACAKTP